MIARFSGPDDDHHGSGANDHAGVPMKRAWPEAKEPEWTLDNFMLSAEYVQPDEKKPKTI